MHGAAILNIAESCQKVILFSIQERSRNYGDLLKAKGHSKENCRLFTEDTLFLLGPHASTQNRIENELFLLLESCVIQNVTFATQYTGVLNKG